MVVLVMIEKHGAQLIGIAVIEGVEIALHHGFDAGTVMAHGLKSSEERLIKSWTENRDWQGRTGGDAPYTKDNGEVFGKR